MSVILRRRCGRARLRGATAGLVVVLIACSASVGVKAEQGVMLDVRNAKLTDVVLMLMEQSGANISINPEVADKPVTARFDGLPLGKVLDYIVTTAGVDYWKTEDGTYIIGRKKPQEEVTPPSVAPEPVAPEPVPASAPRVLHTEVVKLVNLHPDDILVAIGMLRPEENSSTFLGLRYGGVLGLIDEDASHVGIRVPGTPPRPHEEAGGFRMDTAPPAIDGGNRTGAGEAGRAATTETGAGQRPFTPPTAPLPPGVPRPPGTPTSPQAAGTLLPEGVDMVMPFPTDNSLIVRGTDDGIAAFKELVHLLDVPPKQVSIKAEFVEVSTSDIRRLGIDWSLERLNETINTNFNPAGDVVVGFTSGNLIASLRTELTRSAGKIINSPIVSTINNEFAMISIGSTIPYWTTVLVTTGTGGVVSNQVVNSLIVQTYLQVQPRVNGDGTITLMMMPSVQDTGRIFTAPDGLSEIPETRFQTIVTRRRVMNGETIILGGFIRKDESVSTTEIPLLGRLPFIGPLFRSKSVNAQDRELLIFVTPTIIGEKAAGTAVGISPTP